MPDTSWNIVTAGAWNRAILTPAWISRQIFQMAPDAPVDVMVPIDGFAPFQLKYEKLSVTPAAGQLLVTLEEKSADCLRDGMSAMKRAIAELSKTPLRACGINLRFGWDLPPAELLSRWRCPSEGIFSDNHFVVTTRRRGETLEFGSGAINLICDIPTNGPIGLTINFERQSREHSDLLDWLSKPPTDFVDEAHRIVDLLTGQERA